MSPLSPCRNDAAACFAPLLCLVLALWHCDALPLAVYATALRDPLVVLAVSVLYLYNAIPVAWHVAAAALPLAWLAPLLDLLAVLAPAVPPTQTSLSWPTASCTTPLSGSHSVGRRHPLVRILPLALFLPFCGNALFAIDLMPFSEHAWVGRFSSFKNAPIRNHTTLSLSYISAITSLAPIACSARWRRQCEALPLPPGATGGRGLGG